MHISESVVELELRELIPSMDSREAKFFVESNIERIIAKLLAAEYYQQEAAAKVKKNYAQQLIRNQK